MRFLFSPVQFQIFRKSRFSNRNTCIDLDFIYFRLHYWYGINKICSIKLSGAHWRPNASQIFALIVLTIFFYFLNIGGYRDICFFFKSKLQKNQRAKMCTSHWIFEKEEAHQSLWDYIQLKPSIYHRRRPHASENVSGTFTTLIFPIFLSNVNKITFFCRCIQLS